MLPASALLLVAALFAVIPAVSAQAAPSAPPSRAPTKCDDAAHHQFDFWIGNWDVTTPDGKKAGTNEVISILGGCVIQEHWTDTQGSKGESYTIYDAKRGVWHQTWVTDGGNLLVNEGKFAGGKLVLTDAKLGADGKEHVTQRWTWTKIDADHVTQIAETTTDDGKTWTVSFPGHYTRRR